MLCEYTHSAAYERTEGKHSQDNKEITLFPNVYKSLTTAKILVRKL